MLLRGGVAVHSTAALPHCDASAAPHVLRGTPRPCLAASSPDAGASSSGRDADQARGPQALSPRQAIQGVSGINVNGYSPTSLQGWAIVKQTLRDADVKMLSAQEVVFAQKRGVPIIDVRPTDLYEQGHIEGSINIPFYQPISGWEPIKVARRFGYALFGVLNGTEVNPDFARDAAAAVHPELGAILCCTLGGTVEPVEGSKKGLQSRSLIAAWQLVTVGCKNLSVMKGGYTEWVNSGRDVVMLVDVEDA